MDKIYIVTAGDSFTDSHMPFISSDNSNTYLGLHDKLTYHKEMCGPDYSLRYQYFLINELWESGVNFDYYNLGKGSAGNHVITHNYRKKIQKLLDQGVSPKNIYGTLQLSGLVRATNPIYEIEFDLPNVDGAEWDYINNMNPTVSNYKDVLEAHISNIENIIQWNKDKGIEHFNMFFGWAVYYEDELNETIAKIVGPDIVIETITRDIALEVDFSGDLVDAMCLAIKSHDPDGIPVPYTMSGGTDNKALSELGIKGFGFSPLRLPADLDFMALFHGVDERVPIAGIEFGVKVLADFLEMV
jgi:hypothetical protein